MNSTVSGNEIPALSHEEAKELGLLSGMYLLPRTDILRREVLAPSVFSSSRWCRRKLSVPELMDIFDFEVRVQKGILRRVKNPSVAFVKEPPEKLLHHLMVSESMPVSLEVVQETQVNEDVSASLSEKPQVNHGVAESSNDNISAESPTHHADEATAHTKAARVDDAPVDEEEWNKRLAQGYFPEGYDDSIHSPQRRAFNLLRKAMLGWYKHNLNKSFLRYNWHTSLSVSIPAALGGKR